MALGNAPLPASKRQVMALFMPASLGRFSESQVYTPPIHRGLNLSLLLAYFVVENFNPVLKMRKWLTPQTGIRCALI